MDDNYDEITADVNHDEYPVREMLESITIQDETEGELGTFIYHLYAIRHDIRVHEICSWFTLCAQDFLRIRMRLFLK